MVLLSSHWAVMVVVNAADADADSDTEADAIPTANDAAPAVSAVLPTSFENML